jgi:hypothetical protein
MERFPGASGGPGVRTFAASSVVQRAQVLDNARRRIAAVLR